MKKLAVVLLLTIPVVCRAIIVTGFIDVDTYLRRGQDIVIGTCVVANDPYRHWDLLDTAEVDVLRTLKVLELQMDGPQVGDPAPDFTLPRTFEESITLSRLLEDGPLLLHFYVFDFGSI